MKSGTAIRRLSPWQIIVVITVALALLLAPDDSSWAEGENYVEPPPKPDLACANVDSVLAQLIPAEDPEAFGAAHNLAMVGPDQVQVILVMAVGGFLPPEMSLIRVDSQYSNLIRGTVAISDLCSLAEVPGVTRIRPALAHQIRR